VPSYTFPLIVASPNSNSARAAKAATATIPILFMVSYDPTKLGLVARFNRPGSNATGAIISARSSSPMTDHPEQQPSLRELCKTIS
jgi:hypothetical protein